ncbi:MAG: hypothetical protein CMN72_06920 [Sphingomonas sp.]|nr:hypothetical protein [Sphingomonas sp.]
MGKQADAALFERIQSWKSAYDDDETGVVVAIESMLWDYAVFRTTIRIINIANRRHREGGCQINLPSPNQMIFNLLAEGYWTRLLLGTRKMLDRAPLSGPKGVYSLRAILDDVIACQPKLTRRIYVEQLRGCRYDLETLREEGLMALRTTSAQVIWGDPALPQSEMAHQDFDYLSRVDEDNRSENDLMDLSVLELLKSYLETVEVDRISRHVSTHIAHAGNVQSRWRKRLDDFDIRDARFLLKNLKEISGLIGRWFADGGVSDLAIYQGDKFEGLDTALVLAADVPNLELNWSEIEDDVASWCLTPEQFTTKTGA